VSEIASEQIFFFFCISFTFIGYARLCFYLFQFVILVGRFFIGYSFIFVIFLFFDCSVFIL
jgi:hypothetical protein